MTIPNGGTISMGMIRSELKQEGAIKLGSARVRKLAGIPSGAIPMGMLRGKSLETWQEMTLSKGGYGIVSSNIAPANNDYGERVSLFKCTFVFGAQVFLYTSTSWRGNYDLIFKDSNNSQITLPLFWNGAGYHFFIIRDNSTEYNWLWNHRDHRVKFKMKRK